MLRDAPEHMTIEFLKASLDHRSIGEPEARDKQSVMGVYFNRPRSLPRSASLARSGSATATAPCGAIRKR